MKFKLKYNNLIFPFDNEKELKEFVKQHPEKDFQIQIIENGILYNHNDWQPIDNIFNV